MAGERSVAFQVPGAWFATKGEDGGDQPMALVGFQASELIGLPNYSNATVGPAFCMRFVEDTAEARDEGMKICAQTCEKILGAERDVILKLIGQTPTGS